MKAKSKRGFGVLVALAGGALLPVTALTTSSQAAIASTTGAVVKVAAPPSVVENAFESNTQLRAFDERQDVTLTQAACIDVSATGTYRFDQVTSGSLPVGTVVDSHLLHADPVGSPVPTAAVRYRGSITFDADIIGVAIRAATLDCTDFLGAPGTTYPTGNPTRGLEQGDVVVSDNLRTLTINVILHRLDQIRVFTRGQAPPPPGAQGCTPGYWKQPHHFDSWTGFTPSQSFETVFGLPASTLPNDPTLLQALSAEGGGIIALGRHAVAALLNSTSAGVDYRFTDAEVIALVQQAVASGSAATIEATKNRLEAANQSGCPLN